MPNHVLLYTDEPGVGGVAQYNHAILMGLVGRGYSVTCAQTAAQNPLIEQQRQRGVRHEWVPYDTMREFDRTLTDQESAASIFRQTQPDLILFSDGCPFSNFAAKQAAIELNIPYLIVVGFVDPDLAKDFDFCLDRLAQQYQKARSVIAVSHENLHLLHDRFNLPLAKGQVILHGRPDSYFAPRDDRQNERLRADLGIPNGAIVCFTSARLEGIKGYQIQLDAILRLKKLPVWSSLYFVWAGKGALRTELEAAIEAEGIGNRVKLLGHRWNLPDWYDIADIFVFPSYLEGMPLAVIEAMAKGIPVVATAVSGIPEELGDTGKLLTDPKIDPEETIAQLVAMIQDWVEQPQLRQAIGRSGKQRAERVFREERMVQETLGEIDPARVAEQYQALLPEGDYVSPGLAIVRPDAAFPNLIVGNPDTSPWEYLRRDVPHNWYVDRRQQIVGFLNRDEAQILYNTALQFRGKPALEIGCWLGWSACHLALAGVLLDVVDPMLGQAEFYQSVSDSLTAAGVRSSVNLVTGYSPQALNELAGQWSLIFIDGDHESPAPLQDAIACEPLAAPDAIVVFHDLTSPDVAEGLNYFRQKGWQTMIYQTMQIMGVAWRGQVQPIAHQPDPAVNWHLPDHLKQFRVSGITPTTAYTPDFYQATQDGSRQSAREIIPILLNLLAPVQPQRVIDVGCGIGNWLAVFRELGITDCLGIDGEYVDLDLLQIPRDQFMPHDLKQPLSMESRFDLAISLEVAEHLPPDCADTFVQSLTQLAPVVLFSGAIPFQGGVEHINEQWAQYWIDRFARNGFVAIDCLRSQIWQNPNVEPWYAQNVLVFVRQDCLSNYPALAKAAAQPQKQWARVHPQIYLSSLAEARQAAPLGSIAPSPEAKRRVWTTRPLVSIVIPCYKQAHFLPEAVASIVAQTYDHWEIVIVNDGSPDDTSAVAQRLIAAFPQHQIRLVEQKNGGLPNARNVGIGVASGSYILPLDADDKISAEAIEKLLMCCDLDVPCVAFGSYRIFGIEDDTIVSADLYSPDRFKERNMLHPASLFSKQVWEITQGYKVNKPITGYEDWEFWLNCVEHQIPFFGIRDIVVYYRRTSGSMLSQSQQRHDQLFAQIVCYHPQLFGDDAVKNAQSVLQLFERLNPIGITSIEPLKALVAQYQQGSGERLLQVRHMVAQAWLEVAIENLEVIYVGTLRQVHEILLKSGIKTAPPASDSALVKAMQILDQADAPQMVPALMVAMLYLQPDQLPTQIDLNALPQWFLSDYLKFALATDRQERQIAVIRNLYKLQDTNLLICPDWQQPEQLFQTLADCLRSFVSRDESDRTTLLITTDGNAEDADMMISSVVMHLLMEDIDLTETGLEVSLLGEMSSTEQQILQQCISARISLPYENLQTIARWGANIASQPYRERLSSI